MARTQFETFLEGEVNKVKGIYYPVKAGFLRRVMIKSADVSKLHPNPNDEFCLPEIGPSGAVMSEYIKEFSNSGSILDSRAYRRTRANEPIEVEKTRPDGYMILNGHHRWGAAVQMGLDRMPIRIVDLTRDTDILRMLQKSKSTRRVTVDLDEVVFRPADDPYLEKPLRFPLNRYYPERIRRGIPALFQALNRHGCDIWVFTSRYLSLDYLRYYFKHYRVYVTGIVTGTKRNTPGDAEKAAEIRKLFAQQYKTTVTVDNHAVIRTGGEAGSYEEYPLSGNPETWSREVLETFEKMWKE